MRAAISIGILILAFVIYRPIARWVVMPSETRAAWVEPLATVGTGFYHVRECPPFDLLPDWTRETGTAILTKANEQKRRLLAMYASGKGCYGLFQRYSTVEGDWIHTWLLAEDGKLRYVKDHTRDNGASATAVDTFTPKSFRLGFLRDNKFIEGEPGAQDSPILVIQLQTGPHSTAQFY